MQKGIVVVGVPRLGDNFFSVALIEKRASFIHHGAQTFHWGAKGLKQSKADGNSTIYAQCPVRIRFWSYRETEGSYDTPQPINEFQVNSLALLWIMYLLRLIQVYHTFQKGV